jgi:hypothetical protein
MIEIALATSIRRRESLTRSAALSTIFFRDPPPLRSPIMTERCAAAVQITRAARSAAISAAG